jgi:hypothetical protein
MKPRLNQLFDLPFKAVLLQCLDETLQPLPKTTATGFIRRERNDLYLYTCWHVVTGYNKNDLKVLRPPKRIFLQIQMQDAQSRSPGVTSIGGLQSVTVPLYDSVELPRKPLWLQDKRHIPHPDLNAINLYVPFWHDVVKICLPTTIRCSDLQITDNAIFPGNTLLVPGDKLYLVGFPYGFSAQGSEQPTPVVLTRYAASVNVTNRRREILLESAGAPGMSGGPVFVDRGEEISLFGLYTGLLYPDHVIEQNEMVTALGTCADLTFCLWGHLEMVEAPSES